MSWRMAYSLDDLKAEVLQRWPGTVTYGIGDASHAASNSDHNPNAANVVCALDVMVSNIHPGQQQEIWDTILRRRDHRLKYMIWNRHIVNQYVSSWIVRPYGGSSPHTDHIHISVGQGGDGHSYGPYDDRGPWGLLTGEHEEDDLTPAQEAKLDKAIALCEKILDMTGERVTGSAHIQELVGRKRADGKYQSAIELVGDEIMAKLNKEFPEQP